jgi:uncharacterized protein (TIGR00369 family)
VTAPPTLVERFAAARAAGRLGDIIAEIPYARWLGLSAREEAGELISTMAFSPALVGNAALPALHGGTLGALLESAAIFELIWRSETLILPKTITVTIDYLRSAKAVDTHARGIVTRHGRRVANVRVEAWQDARAAPVASAHAIFLVGTESNSATNPAR